MEHEHEVEEDGVRNGSLLEIPSTPEHTLDKTCPHDNDSVVIARRSCRSSAYWTVNLMMRTITCNDTDGSRSVITLNEECRRGGGGHLATHSSSIIPPRCDSSRSSSSDNLNRLRKMSRSSDSHYPACRRQQQQQSEQEYPRACRTSGNTCPDSPSQLSHLRNLSWWRINSGNMLMILLCTVFLLTGGVSSESTPDGATDQRNPNRYHNDDKMAEHRGTLGSNGTLSGFSVIPDINLIDDEADYFGPFTSANNHQHDNQVEEWGTGDPSNNKEHYTHQWAVHILGGPEVARKVAEKHGFQFHGEVQ